MGAAEQGPAEHGAGLQAFDELLAAIAECAQADDQQALARAFVERYPTAPLVSETEAVILYWGPAESVLLRGDMLQERSAPLIRLAHTQLWFHRGSYAPDARLDYHLLVDGRDLAIPGIHATRPAAMALALSSGCRAMLHPSCGSRAPMCLRER